MPARRGTFILHLPIFVGGASFLAVLANRAVLGIAPVIDASSSQSSADLLTLGLAVTNILTGLVWLTIRPKSISVVNPQGVECQFICSHLPEFVVSELLWHGNLCQVLHAAALAVDAAKLMQGSLYRAAIKSASLAISTFEDTVWQNEDGVRTRRQHSILTPIHAIGEHSFQGCYSP
ncbi:hypothetical protein Peur_055977 [Populus x canadensis]